MTAHDQIRAMLDQLMGTSRNGEEEKLSIKFDDPKVCKSFLLGCCPHEILASTRMDLGDCPKIHNLALRADYEKASVEKNYYYDMDAIEQLSIFINDADRKTELAKKRLAETQDELSIDVNIKADKIHELAEKIGESLVKAEELGADGNVNESIKLMNEIDELRKEKSNAELEYRSSIPSATYQQQKLRVCEVCCAYLGIHDNDRRLADHFGGKLHLGFIKIRDMLTEFKIKIEERRKNRRDDKKKSSNNDNISRHNRYEKRDDAELHHRSKRKRSKDPSSSSSSTYKERRNKSPTTTTTTTRRQQESNSRRSSTEAGEII